MSDYEVVKSYRTNDGYVFDTEVEAKYHAQELEMQSLQEDHTFQTKLHDVVGYLISEAYVALQYTKRPVTINLDYIERHIGHEIVDYSELNAFGDELAKKLREFNLNLKAVVSSQDERARRSVSVTFIDEEQAFSAIKDYLRIQLNPKR